MLGRGAPAEAGWGENLFDSPLRALIHWRIPYLATCSLFLPPSSHLPLPPIPTACPLFTAYPPFILFHFLYVLRSHHTPTAAFSLLLESFAINYRGYYAVPRLPPSLYQRGGKRENGVRFLRLSSLVPDVCCGGSMFTSSLSTDFSAAEIGSTFKILLLYNFISIPGIFSFFRL